VFHIIADERLFVNSFFKTFSGKPVTRTILCMLKTVVSLLTNTILCKNAFSLSTAVQLLTLLLMINMVLEFRKRQDLKDSFENHRDLSNSIFAVSIPRLCKIISNANKNAHPLDFVTFI